MKIMFLVSSLETGGAERVASTLCNAWAERGEIITLVPTFSGGGKCFYELFPAVNLVYLSDLVTSRKRSFSNQFARLKALRSIFLRDRPDVIVSFLSNVNVAALIASFGLGVSVVVCERTDPFLCPTPLMLRIARRLTYPFAASLVVQTKSVARNIKIANWYLKNIKVIANPIPQKILNIQTFNPTTSGKRILLAVGRLSEEKQFGLLIKVFSHLAFKQPYWNLRIVGDGPLRVTLQQQIVASGLCGRVELPGRSSNISDELNKAHSFVLTSKFEGFPNALLEAMAVGLPCVAFDCPSGPREMTLDGAVAMLVPANDEHALGHALSKLMTSVDLRQSLGESARVSVIERYSLNNILGRWDSLFNDLKIKR